MLNYPHLLVSVRYLPQTEFSSSSDIHKIVKCTHSNLSSGFVDSDLCLFQGGKKATISNNFHTSSMLNKEMKRVMSYLTLCLGYVSKANVRFPVLCVFSDDFTMSQ